MLNRITKRAAFTALIAVFVLHNMEEAYSICRFPAENLFSFFQPLQCNQFLWAVSILTIVVLFVYGIAMRTIRPKIYLFVSTAIASSLLLNVFVPHSLVSIYTMKYTPGIFSAAMLNFPLCILVLFKNKESYSTGKQMLFHSMGGILIGYILFAVAVSLVKHLI